MTPLPPAPPPRRSPWGKVLIGCAIVGGLAILVGLAVGAFGLYWLTSAGRHYPTAAVASERSQGIVRVGDLAGDAGARALLTRLFTRIQEAGDGPQLPQWMRNMQAYQARQGISQWLPREATLSMEPDPEGVPRIVLAANMKGFVKPMRLAVTQAVKGDRKASITHHGGHEVLNFGAETSLCFMEGTLVVSYHPSQMDPALDRLAAASPAPTSPASPDARAFPGRWDLSGWLGQETGTGVLVGLLASPDNTFSSAAPPLQGLRDVRFGIDIESEDDARVAAEVAFDDADSAAGAQPWLDRGLADLRTRMEPSGLSATTTDTVDGDRVRFELKVHGLQAAFDRLIRAQEENRRQRPRR